MNKYMSVSITLFLLLILTGASIALGVTMSHKFPKLRNYIPVGCWREVSSGERAIAISVSHLDIEELEDTLRHEVCHEIYYRLTSGDYTVQETEDFADGCIIKDYINESEGGEK